MSQGGDKTEKATPKKRRDARQEGQVLKSTEVSTAFCCIVMFGFLLLFTPSLIDGLAEIMQNFLTGAFILSNSDRMDSQTLDRVFLSAVSSAAKIVLPILLCSLLAGLIVNIAQVGFLFTTKALKPKFNRISPISGFKRLFSLRSLTELLKSILKVIFLGYIAYGEYTTLITHFPNMIAMNLYKAIIEILTTACRIALKMCIALAIIAAADYLFQWWKHEKDLMMTKQEIKDEYKLTEGDPQIKGKIRQKQRQMSAMRMMDAVPSADVVITNPTHFAIALKYDQGRSGAPVVVAKGADYLARRIKETAREHNIQIVENKPLAQALYQYCEVDDEIPSEFYQVVADILVYVYRLKNGGRSR